MDNDPRLEAAMELFQEYKQQMLTMNHAARLKEDHPDWGQHQGVEFVVPAAPLLGGPISIRVRATRELLEDEPRYNKMYATAWLYAFTGTTGVVPDPTTGSSIEAFIPV